MTERGDAAAGCLLGAAVGDARGLPWEGMSRRRQKRMRAYVGDAELVTGSNMCSDDTDHACMVAQAIAVSAGSPRRFLSSLSWRLRFWLLGLPAGVGFATLRAILKLWLFVPPQFSGVRSAGNGPAMRSAILGVAFSESDPLLLMHVSASSAMTHSDPRAQFGALAVAPTEFVSRDPLVPSARSRYLAEIAARGREERSSEIVVQAESLRVRHFPPPRRVRNRSIGREVRPVVYRPNSSRP